MNARAQLAHKQNRERQRKGHEARGSWRESPATKAQIEALRILATSTGKTFRIDITRGEAWRRIREADVTLSLSLRRRCAPPWWSRSR